MKKELNKKIILISGVGKGLGKTFLENCIENGARVIGFTRSSTDLKKIKKKYLKKSKIFIGDGKNTKFIDEIFSFLKSKNIELDGLINNAGERQRSSFIDIDYEEIKKLTTNNFLSKFYLTQKFIKHIKKRNISRSIVNIGSIVGEIGFSNLVGYGSTKAALIGFTKCLAVELAKKNINCRVNIINPGFVKTSYFKNFTKNKKLYKWTINNTPMRRWAEPVEISNLAIFLLSNKSSYLNGQKINIDGGWTAK
tara:strand:+ start:19120 stop:19875 length:756 start_codon:yes stop_codon:yes gene_type:complete